MTFDLNRELEALIEREGGFVDHPDDKGGPTCWGITEAVARSEGYVGDMRALPRAVARAIYARRYWDRPNFDAVAALSPALAAELFDTGVNMGPTVPSAWLQRWLNALNRQGHDYRDIAVDGVIGAATLGALQAYLRLRGPEGERVMVRALNCSQGARYLELTEARVKNESFLFGWMRTRVA